MALPSSMEPKANEYAGDEVSALVLDPGYSSVRAGFAGEDTPKSIIPTYYAEVNSKRSFGEHVIDQPREDVGIKNPMNQDGLVEDWDAAEALWKFSFAGKLTGVRPNKALQEWLNDHTAVPDLQKSMAESEDLERCLEEHPLFMTEPSWNPARAREKATEIAIETWQTPAFFLGRQGVMAAFATGKPSALVIDIGACQMSCTPVHDGVILKKGVMRSPLAGNYVSSQVRNTLANYSPTPIAMTPHYKVKSKSPVDANQPAQFIRSAFASMSNPPKLSFDAYVAEKVVLEFKESSLEAWHHPSPFRSPQSEAIAATMTRPFEFPDGYNQLFGTERFRIVESLFDNQCHTPTGNAALEYPSNLLPAFSSPDASQTLPALVKQALNAVDIDIRPHLLMNVVLTGGSSGIDYMPDRVQAELTRLYPSTRVRVHAAGMSVERKYGSWIGGSIMASLGTFHQMWVSRKEYEEHGASIVEKRCK